MEELEESVAEAIDVWNKEQGRVRADEVFGLTHAFIHVVSAAMRGLVSRVPWPRTPIKALLLALLESFRELFGIRKRLRVCAKL